MLLKNYENEIDLQCRQHRQMLEKLSASQALEVKAMQRKIKTEQVTPTSTITIWSMQNMHF